MKESNERLTIGRVDEASLDLFAGAPIEDRGLVAEELIPFVEWSCLRASWHTLHRIVAVGPLLGLATSLQSGQTFWAPNSSHGLGFIRVRRQHADVDNPAWLAFCRRFESAAISSGLQVRTAKQLTGAMGELEDNIHWHSERPQSGFVAFMARKGLFEFVVLDRGIGVLASLKRAPEFAEISDDGVALELAVAEGNSRFGRESRRGYGFSDLFLGVAQQRALLRFRSGDHVLELDGSEALNPTARRRQLARTQGFMIAVRCLI